MKNCSIRSQLENTYVNYVKEVVCFQVAKGKCILVSGIQLYVYDTGIAIINDCYCAKQLGLKQEDYSVEELKELVEKRVEANTGWQFRG